jgi:hypothetical protein
MLISPDKMWDSNSGVNMAHLRSFRNLCFQNSVHIISIRNDFHFLINFIFLSNVMHIHLEKTSAHQVNKWLYIGLLLTVIAYRSTIIIRIVNSDNTVVISIGIRLWRWCVSQAFRCRTWPHRWWSRIGISNGELRNRWTCYGLWNINGHMDMLRVYMAFLHIEDTCWYSPKQTNEHYLYQYFQQLNFTFVMVAISCA